MRKIRKDTLLPFVACVLLFLLGAFVNAQLGPSATGSPPSRDGISLIDDRDISGRSRLERYQRYRIVGADKWVILIDEATGNTWYLAIDDATREPFWATMRRKDFSSPSMPDPDEDDPFEKDSRTD